MQPATKRKLLRGIVIALVVLGLVGASLAGCFVYQAQHAFHSCVPVDEALFQVRNHPEAVSALGEPIEPGWWIQGTLSTSSFGTSGSANLTVPLKGPKGSGHAQVVAVVRPNGVITQQWVFEPLAVTVDGGPTLTLSVPPRCSTGSCATGAYVQALRKVRSDARVTGRLGTPIEDGRSLTGGMSSSGGEGSADFDTRIEGPKGADFDTRIEGPKGADFMIGSGTMTGGVWRVDSLKILFPVKDGSEQWNREAEGVETIVLVEAGK